MNNGIGQPFKPLVGSSQGRTDAEPESTTPGAPAGKTPPAASSPEVGASWFSRLVPSPVRAMIFSQKAVPTAPATPPRVPGPSFTGLPTDTLGEVYSFLDGRAAVAFMEAAPGAVPAELQPLVQQKVRLTEQTEKLLRRLGDKAEGTQEMSSLAKLKAARLDRDNRASEPLTEARVAELYRANCAGDALLRGRTWHPNFNAVSKEDFATHLQQHVGQAGGQAISAEQCDAVWATLFAINALENSQTGNAPYATPIARRGGPVLAQEIDSLMASGAGTRRVPGVAYLPEELRAPVAAYLREHRQEYKPLPEGYDGTTSAQLPPLSEAAFAELAPRYAPGGDLKGWSIPDWDPSKPQGWFGAGQTWSTRIGKSPELLRAMVTKLVADYETRKATTDTPELKLQNVATLYRELLLHAPWGKGTGVFLQETLVPLLLAKNGLPVTEPTLRRLGTVAELANELRSK